MTSSLPQGWIGFLFLLALLLPGWVLRAGYEHSLWMDEFYSLKMALKPLNELIDATTFDAHPPGYYLLLKAWLAVGRWFFGEEPGLLWARLLGVGGLIALAAMAWEAGRRLFGGSAGALMAWLVTSNAFVQLLSRSMRNYALVIPALFACFLLMLWMWERDGARESRVRLQWWGAALYFVCAVTALWLHLLSAVVLTMLGMAWLFLLVVRRGPWLSPLRLGLGIAQALAAFSFVPWLVQLKYQLRYLSNAPTPWMSPADWPHLGYVFAYWIPWGDEGALYPAALVAGSLALLLPAALALVGWLRVDAKPTSPVLGRAAALGLWVGAGFVVAIWVVSYLGLAKVFHGPRYTVLTVPALLVALAAMAVLGARKLMASETAADALALAAILPLLVLSTTGTLRNHSKEGAGGLPGELHAAAPEALPREGEHLYVLGSEVIPYMPQTLAKFRPLPIEAITHLPEGTKGLTVLATDHWESIWPFRDRLARAMILNGKAAESGFEVAVGNSFTLLRVDGIDQEKWARLFEQGIHAERTLPAGALALALPEHQPIFPYSTPSTAVSRLLIVSAREKSALQVRAVPRRWAGLWGVGAPGA
ncbi:hypothetical protein GC173_18240 [bacterium]|nr:hypothetical protein [bacterium]